MLSVLSPSIIFSLTLAWSACNAVTTGSIHLGDLALASQTSSKSDVTTSNEDLKNSLQPQRERFAEFVQMIGTDERISKQGVLPSKEAWTPIVISKLVKISPNEEAVVRSFVVLAYDQLAEISKQMSRPASSGARTDAEWNAFCDALQAKREGVYDELVRELRRQLGKDDFDKLNRWISEVFPSRPRSTVHLRALHGDAT